VKKRFSINLNVALIEQAFVNLLDNAIKYSGPGSSIEIEAQQMDAEVAILFRDHGIGIASEHLPRLFERFLPRGPLPKRSWGGPAWDLRLSSIS